MKCDSYQIRIKLTEMLIKGKIIKYIQNKNPLIHKGFVHLNYDDPYWARTSDLYPVKITATTFYDFR